MSIYLPMGTTDSDPYFTDTNEYDDEEPTAAEMYEAELHGEPWPRDEQEATRRQYRMRHGGRP